MMTATLIAIITTVTIINDKEKAIAYGLYVMPLFAIIMKQQLRKHKPKTKSSTA